MLMLMFSMAGVPPFVGFWAKLAVIQAVLNVGSCGSRSSRCCSR
jgi:NADH-quinone oxidoreductase subunit N